MARRIEDYAVIGNCETMALVGSDGSIDWLGLPRFDSPACFAALLGDERHGRWLIAPIDGAARSTRHYRGNTLILETIFELETGSVRIVDFMSRRDGDLRSHPHRLRHKRRGGDACRTDCPLRLWFRDALGDASERRAPEYDRGTGPAAT